MATKISNTRGCICLACISYAALVLLSIDGLVVIVVVVVCVGDVDDDDDDGDVMGCLVFRSRRMSMSLSKMACRNFTISADCSSFTDNNSSR